MGKPTAQDDDLARQAVSAVFTAVGQTTEPKSFTGHFNIFVGDENSFTGSVGLEASYDGGVVFLPLTFNGAAVSIAARAVERLEQWELGVLIRARCLTLSAGAIAVRLSQ